MAFRALYEMDGKTMHALAVNYEVSRKIDPHGQKASGPKGGRVTVTVQCTEDTAVLAKMLNDPFAHFNAKIIFKKPNENSDMKVIDLQEAYCVYAFEELDIDAEFPFVLKFTLSANKMDINGDLLENNWKH